MRERITIVTPGGFSMTSSGQTEASGDASATFYAEVHEGDRRQDINMNQNKIENAYTFRIRNDQLNSYSKVNRIIWSTEVYSIVFVSNQSKYHRFIDIIATSSD